ncbi:AraC family transcriptional regulator [Fibrisoma montanum]|uniref:AraC family transcriptional regulator n=1 Tax=Fibrisoma montanum TaxID=2305895 RepID=A0A418MHN3_9BACT|nr:AraC family transcriptional regulator [Fibrisoma montanum]RIV26936.1 AraC family transcriptional regulator [Fibrisoma montanum]
MPADATISSASVKGLLYAVTQCGADAKALSQAAGLDSTLLKDPDGRVPMATMQRLWALAVQATNDPHLDLHLAGHVHHSSYGVLAYVLMNCPTVGAAIHKLCLYGDIVCNGTRISLRHRGNSVELVVDITSPTIVYPHFVLNSELSIYLHMLRGLSGQWFDLEAVYLAYPAPANTREHERVFSPAPVQFDSPYSALRLPATVLALPIPTADPQLLAMLEPHAAALLERLHERPALADRVRHELLRLLVQSAPTLEAVARALSLSPRTLQLQLRQDGHSYQQLLDEVRRELAEDHLRAHILSIKDIAFLLGFAEPGVFIRAFRRWTGQTPGMFRRGTG